MLCANTLTGFVDGTFLPQNFGLAPEYASELRRVSRQLSEHAGYAVTLPELSPRLIAGFLSALLAAGRSPVTVNSKRRELLTLWRAAYRMKLAPRPGRIKRLVEPDPIPTAWTQAECDRIFAACAALLGTIAGICRADWWLSLFLVVWATGERIKAIRSARSTDFDPTAGTLTIRWANQKTRKNRLLWLAPEATEAVLRIHDHSRDRLWPWPHCRPHFFVEARRIIEAAGVECPKTGKNLFQKLRRTSGSLVEAAGGDGALFLANSREVFLKHYRAPSLCGGSQVRFLPRPTLPGG